jgi:hypothetical protein
LVVPAQVFSSLQTISGKRLLALAGPMPSAAGASAAALVREAAALEAAREYHEAVSKLEQAKAVLMEDSDAAAAEHRWVGRWVVARGKGPPPPHFVTLRGDGLPVRLAVLPRTFSKAQL